jgi:hypothetical protein
VSWLALVVLSRNSFCTPCRYKCIAVDTASGDFGCSKLRLIEPRIMICSTCHKKTCLSNLRFKTLCTHVYAENCEHRHDQDIIATSIKTLLPEATDNKSQNESEEGIIFFFSDSAIMPNRQKLVDVLESDEQWPAVND